MALKKTSAPVTFLASFAQTGNQLSATNQGGTTIRLDVPESDRQTVYALHLALADQVFRVTITPGDGG